MNEQRLGLIILIRNAITGKNEQLPQNFDIEKAYMDITRHQIASLVYGAAVKCGISEDAPAMRRLQQDYYICTAQNDRQLVGMAQLYKAFDNHKIDYLPLKGSHLKFLYPKPNMRPMGDADILIRVGQYDDIIPVMKGLGFKKQRETDHEIVWNSQLIHVELHKKPIPQYNPDFCRYFGDGWQLAKLKSGTCYEMKPEDEFIYLFAHFAKHYRNGGIGCRHVTDLWVFRRSYPDLDEAYLQNEFEKFHLKEFYLNINNLLSAWFENGEWNEKINFITDFIFRSGAWGRADAHAVSLGVKNMTDAGSYKAGRSKEFRNFIFPDAGTLAIRYPVLKKHKWLLPFFWPVRWITALLFRRKNIHTQKKAFELATRENIEKMQESLHYVGLGFYQEEVSEKTNKQNKAG